LANTSPGLRWVLSLSERHSSIFGEHVDGGTVLHIQDRHATMFAKLVLSTDERPQWLLEVSKHAT
jgi:hypothetical protein